MRRVSLLSSSTIRQLNTDTPQGEFMLTILAAVAQLERATIRERQAEGIAIAKRTASTNRAPKLTPSR
jgi:DNA invertase Pin-like site-specific DNA recombinase